MTERTDRIDELLRQEIGSILTREVKDPRVGFATVTRVETAPDLGHARVWISVIGQQAERKETIAALDGVMHFVRRELGARLRLRRIPVLHVRLDDTLERGTRLLHLLDELEAGRTPDDLAPDDETLPTPIVRLRHEGDLADEPPPAAEPPPPARSRRSRRSLGPTRAGGTVGRPTGAQGTKGPREAKGPKTPKRPRGRKP
ncbi:MAG: 30S ribosome-binding factor RbfA [Chloroflexota bacterium]|nr:30S ribosome-binding factor RbfA [Chloroflexota bacterium]